MVLPVESVDRTAVKRLMMESVPSALTMPCHVPARSAAESVAGVAGGGAAGAAESAAGVSSFVHAATTRAARSRDLRMGPRRVFSAAGGSLESASAQTDMMQARLPVG